MAEKKKSVLSDPKQRMMYLTFGAVAVVSIVGGLYVVNSPEDNVQPAGASVSSIPRVESIPASSTSVDYNEKVQLENQQKAEKALNNNSSFVPTLTANNPIADISPIDFAAQERERIKRLQEEKIQEPAPVVVPPAPKPAPVAPPPAPVVTKPAPPPAPPVDKKKYSYEDAVIISALIEAGKSKASNSEFNYVGGGSASGYTPRQNVASIPNLGMNTPNMGKDDILKAAPLYKAGDVLHAILETSVNSDEPSPVMAKIVSGDLKGTRLIGSIQVVGKKVVLEFKKANIPGESRSITISAVAVDPSTSRTALATDVDNHYLARYGLLIASTFLSGWSQAIAQNNMTTTYGPLGNVTQIPKDGLDSRDINKQAFGQVGTELANTARSNIQDFKPTIKVDGGIAIGILLMDDLVVE